MDARTLIRRVLKPLVWACALTPAAILLGRFLADDLGANPIETITNWTGYTTLVLLTMLPFVPIYAGAGASLGLFDALGVSISAMGIVVQAVADDQLRAFVKAKTAPDQICDVGLWKYSRHPNYLGEILFWWGLWLFGLAAAPDWWWTVLGPITMVLLFVFVSVPMMDRRSAARRPGYARHMRRVPALFPRPPRDG